MPNGDEEVTVDLQTSPDPVETEVVPGSDLQIMLHEIPPQYSLAVAWGDFEALYADAATVNGKQERLQALGFYYGSVDGDDGAITRRGARHMREEADHAAGRTLTDEEFATEFRRQIRAIVRKLDGTLAPEDDFLQNARLMFPGSFCFTDINQLGNPIARARFNAEKRMWDNNATLGRIPILATVTNTATGTAAAGVKVIFEFIPAFDPPEGQKTYLNTISNQSEKTHSPRAFVRSKLPATAHAQFGFNCVEAKGGKIPADVLGSLFAQGAVQGFPYQASAEGRPNNFSVTADTDASGVTGVVFTPSRMAGDAYKIKVTVKVDGREATAQECKTSGVLTVWRSLRLARIVQKTAQGAWAGQPPLAAAMTGALGTISPTTMRTEYAKAFHWMEIDHRAHTPINMTARSYVDAIQFAKRGINNPNNYDLNALILENFASPFLFWLDTDTNYNANRTAGTAALNLAQAATWNAIGAILDQLIDRFMIYWNGGSLPGVTVVRSEVGDSYSYWNTPNRPTYGDGSRWTHTTSGVATSKRGCFVWYPLNIYQTNMSYGLTQNTMHEMGHVLYLRHHYTTGALGTEGGGFPANHDQNDWCLMGYLTLNTNDYCGKCLLKLRGWDETTI